MSNKDEYPGMEETHFLGKIKNLSRNTKIIVAVLSICLVVGMVSYAGASGFFNFPSNVTYPDGKPTPTPVPTASPIPTATPTPKTDTFTVTATVNGTTTDPSSIAILSGGYIGTTYTVVYSFQSTANQPITVTASVPAETPVTGNAQISWDATTQANNYAVSLPVNGATATMTMYVTLGTEGGSIPLVFTPTP